MKSWQFEACELPLLELVQGTTPGIELYLDPCSAILLPNLIVTCFGSNVIVLPALQMDDMESKFFPSVGNMCDIRSSEDRVDKSKVPSCVAEITM